MTLHGQKYEVPDGWLRSVEAARAAAPWCVFGTSGRQKLIWSFFVSDNRSWVDQGHGRGTALLAEWSEFRQRNPNPRLVCLDVQPNQTTHAGERADILKGAQRRAAASAWAVSPQRGPWHLYGKENNP